MATEEVIAQAKEKIARQINDYEDLKRESGVSVIMPTDERSPFKEYLFNRIETVEGFAEKVLQECKSVEKGLAWSATKIPEKIKKMKMVHLSTEDVFKLFCDYFDWDEEKERQEKEAARKKREEERKKKAEKSKAKAKITPTAASDDSESEDSDDEDDAEDYMEKYRKSREEAEARRKEAEERKKREKLGICEGQLDIFGLCGVSEPTKVEEGKPQEEPSCPITLVRPIEQNPVEEDVVVEVDDDPRLPFSLEVNPFEKTEEPSPETEEPKAEETAEEDIYDLLGF